MKRGIYLLLILVFIGSGHLYAQKPYKVKLSKQAFLLTEDGFADAWKALKKGHRYFKQDKHGSYQLAVPLLKTAYQYNPDYAILNYELGVSYLKIYDFENGLKYIENAIDIDPNVTPDIHLWLGRAYHLNSRFDDAIDEYEIFKSLLDTTKKKNRKIAAQVDRYIQQCKNAIELKKNKTYVIIDNMGGGINTEYDEYAPVFAPYDSIVFFTSRRPSEFNKKRNRKISNDFYEDIYYTSYKLGKWHPADIFPKPVNSRGNDAVVAVNPTGTELIIRRGIDKGSFFLTKRKDVNKWTKPKPVIKKINRKNSFETTLTFSHDSSTVYFVSDRPGGIGGKDIWVTHKTANGWSKPKNLGSQINTPYDEEGVFISPNDSVLYFSSKGHNSIGGYDIFRVYKLPDGRWSEPENLGFGINTPGDDLFIFVSQDNRTGYFTSNGQPGGYGGYDIFDFFFYTPKPLFTQDSPDELIAFLAEPVNEITMEPPVPIKVMRLTVVKGTVTEYGSGKPLNATIEIVDNETQEVVQVVKTNATTGEYMVMLPSGKNYGMSVNAKGHMFHSENFDIPAAQGYQEIRKDIQLMPVNPGSKVVLRNVFFDFNSATLKPESYAELNRLAQILKQYPGIVVEISGHTDNIGSFQYNMKLSQKRAEAVVEYLIAQGVPPESLVAKGYGPTKPIAPNDTEEGRALNRRVEAKVLKNPYAVQSNSDTTGQDQSQ